MLCGRLDGRKIYRRMYTCVRMTESLCYSPETISTLLISHTPMQNIKLKKKKRILFWLCAVWDDQLTNNFIYWGGQLSQHCYSAMLCIQSCPTLATPWTIACQAPLSLEFSRQEYWSGLPFPSPIQNKKVLKMELIHNMRSLKKKEKTNCSFWPGDDPPGWTAHQVNGIFSLACVSGQGAIPWVGPLVQRSFKSRNANEGVDTALMARVLVY